MPEKNSREEQLQRIADNAARAKRKADEPEAAKVAEESAPDPDALDLDDPMTQERIINPEGSVVELSYGTITIYPPSAMVRRLAYGFVQGIIAEVAASRPPSQAVFALRTLSTLMATAAPQLQLFRLVASICGKPGKIDDKTALELATEIAEHASPDDVATLFERLSVAAGLGTPGKSPAKK